MTIEALGTPGQAREWCRLSREAGASLGLVPTMGALHEGHLGLVRRALEENDRACASVFVNPLQFGEASDLEKYPRDFEADVARLDSIGCHMVFTGTLEQFFEGELDRGGSLPADRLLHPGPQALGLEGEFRSGHFEGVATIVDRLFEVASPDRAYFGQKDFQQSLVVSELARARGGPRVVICPIAREPSGLARSSRNELLEPRDRERAACIAVALSHAARAWRSGVRSVEALEGELAAALDRPGVELEYATVRDPSRWSPGGPTWEFEEAVALVAVRIGGVRLIDNHLLGEPGPVTLPPAAEPRG